jgi:uncharacterized membrane protein
MLGKGRDVFLCSCAAFRTVGHAVCIVLRWVEEAAAGTNLLYISLCLFMYIYLISDLCKSLQ